VFLHCECSLVGGKEMQSALNRPTSIPAMARPPRTTLGHQAGGDRQTLQQLVGNSNNCSLQVPDGMEGHLHTSLLRDPLPSALFSLLLLLFAAIQFVQSSSVQFAN
jgi:hypothetical protein